MNILVLTMGYPSNTNTRRLVFLERFINELVDLGNQCTVIAPCRKFRNEGSSFSEEIHFTSNHNPVKVFFPKFYGIWYESRIKHDLIREFTIRKYTDAILDIINNNNIKFDCIYSHFLGVSAIAGIEIAQIYKVPVFAAAGESEFTDFEGLDKKEYIDKLNELDGIIAVSSYNKIRLLKNNILEDERILVSPNSIDTDFFYKRNKLESRKRFDFKSSDFIIGFVGHFIERKGPLRLLEAKNKIKDYDIKLAYAGNGVQVPYGKDVIFSNNVDPNDMPYFLSACDLFVLPTLNEGCCNAIIEAMACGLPVVSSDLPFNDDILDNTCSILVNPRNIDSISDAIKKIVSDRSLLFRLAASAQEKGKSFSLKKRAENVSEWIRSIMDEYEQN